MKTVNISLKGISPLLIHRFGEDGEIPKNSKRGKKDYGTPREQAEATAYCDAESGLLWIPSTWIKGALQAVASDYKLVGTRKSVKSVSGGAILPLQEKIYFEEKFKKKDLEVDSRPVVIQRARIMRHRARLENWTIRFDLEIEEDILDLDLVHQMMTDSGRRSGIGDFRPQKGGPFGRFQLVFWSVL